MADAKPPAFQDIERMGLLHRMASSEGGMVPASQITLADVLHKFDDVRKAVAEVNGAAPDQKKDKEARLAGQVMRFSAGKESEEGPRTLFYMLSSDVGADFAAARIADVLAASGRIDAAKRPSVVGEEADRTLEKIAGAIAAPAVTNKVSAATNLPPVKTPARQR